jgi:hypothetical protein
MKSILLRHRHLLMSNVGGRLLVERTVFLAKPWQSTFASGFIEEVDHVFVDPPS